MPNIHLFVTFFWSPAPRFFLYRNFHKSVANPYDIHWKGGLIYRNFFFLEGGREKVPDLMEHIHWEKATGPLVCKGRCVHDFSRFFFLCMCFISFFSNSDVLTIIFDFHPDCWECPVFYFPHVSWLEFFLYYGTKYKLMFAFPPYTWDDVFTAGILQLRYCLLFEWMRLNLCPVKYFVKSFRLQIFILCIVFCS